MRNNYGGYTPLTIANEVLSIAPKPVTQAWAQVTTAQKRYTQARDQLAILEVDANSAPAADAAAARAAVETGKPVPPETAQAATDAVETKRREIAALVDIADELEWNFLAILTDHKTDLVDGYKAATERDLEDAQAALTAASEAASRFTMSAALWQWARSDDTGQPPRQGFHVRTPLGQDVDSLISVCKTALDHEHPDETIAAENAYRAELAALSGRTTADGLIKDAAAYAAYDR